MGERIRKQWNRISDTGIYSTGYYLVTPSEMKAMFESESLDNGENISKIENRRIITTQLSSDKRISVHFFPFKGGDRYIMEGLASSAAFENIHEILPKQMKQLLVSKSPIQHG